MPILIALLAAVLVVLTVPAPPADAQPVKIETTRKPTEREARIVPPPLHYESTRPPEADYYPRGTLVEYDPAFIEPFAGSYQTTTGSGRYGLSGWSSPNPPIGSELAHKGHEDPGVLSFGFSVTWDGPPARVVPAQRPR
jgi:hypothetical protein